MAENSYRLEGRVIDTETEQGLAGLQVEAWDRDTKNHDRLGAAQTNAQGNFAIQFDESAFKDSPQESGPDLVFKVFEGERLLLNTVKNPIKNWTSERNPVILKVEYTHPDEPDKPETGKPYVVEGEVVDPRGRPLSDLPVRAYDRALCDWRLLGEARTNDSGNYRIGYTREQLKAWGKRRADLKVEVYDRATADEVLAASPLILQALPLEVVDFSIGGEYVGPDEYNSVHDALEPLLGPVEDLACLEVVDVQILARDSGQVASNVAIYLKARRWSENLEIQAAVFYGLLRQGVATELDALFARPFSRLWESLEQAKRLNIIDLRLDESQKIQFGEIQQNYLQSTDHPYRQLLGTTSLDSQQQTTFTGLLTASTLGSEELWRALEQKAGFSQDQIGELQSTFELQSLTGDNSSLTIHLRSVRGVAHPRETAAYRFDDWLDALSGDGVEIPDVVLPGGPEPQRRQSYAQLLYRSAEVRFQTASLTAQMSRDTAWAQHSTTAWLAANPTFELKGQRLTLYLAQHPETLAAFAEPDVVKQDLLRLEQFFHLTASSPQDRLKIIQPLWDTEFASAPQIAYGGRQSLVQQVSDRIEPATINAIYDQAVHNTAFALNLYMRYSPQANGVSMNALDISTSASDVTTPGGATGLPEWEALFGAADACECNHCESALSPAAYLVDMLSFLGRATDGASANGLDAFLARRPDIGMLDLTCENSDAELPQIDLFIEIAEQIIANSSDGITLPTTSVGQTTWDSSLLAAQPEHFEPHAYDLLLQAVHPFTLPFDLWLEEARSYLSQMGVARAELMARMPAHRGMGPVDVAIESLSLSPTEAEIVATPHQHEQVLADYWGIDLVSGSLSSQLRSVQTLLAHAGIDYDTLLRLLNTRYLNPARLIEVVFSGNPCELDNAELTGGDTISFLDRCHRFLRLQNKLGWSEAELDQVLQAIGVADFDDPAFFPMVAALKTMHGDYSLSISELTTWWADLDSYRCDPEQQSQYEAIFLDPARFPENGSSTGPDLSKAVFALTPDGTDLVVTQSGDPNLSLWLAKSGGAAAPTYTLDDDYAAYVQSATGLMADDLTLLVANILAKDPVLGHIALNLANVSQLYRIASFTRAIGVSVPDYLYLLRLTDMEPLTTSSRQSNPLDTEQFIDAWNKTDGAGWSLEELDYLLLHGNESAAELSPDPAQVKELLLGLSAGFVGLTGTSTSDPITSAKSDEKNLELAAQSLGTTLGLDPELLKELLFELRPDLGDRFLEHLILAANPDLTTVIQPAQDFYTLFETLHKFALAWKPLELIQAHLDFIVTVGPNIGWTDIVTLPTTEQIESGLQGWHRLCRAAELQETIFAEDLPLFDLLAEAHQSPPTLTRATFLIQTEEWTGWNLDDVTYLLGPAGFKAAWPDDFRNERWLSKLEQIFALILPLGVTVSQAHTWARPALEYQDAQAIKQALSLAYDHDTWLEVMANTQDELRVLRRDALLNYMLGQRPGEDAADIHAHYLIDPLMDPCAVTSRMVQAHASVQLFAQRILLNLEPTLSFSREDAEGWVWRKKYRIWQAAREIFCYPQNFLMPEVRDNKSVFFRELEDGLLQDEVNSENAETLYREYLYKLDEVSRLELMGLYRDEDAGILHVIGRTRDIPHLYFYRRWEDGIRWTPWERVELDIQSDHLIPIVYNGRLYLFWSEFAVSENIPGTAELDKEIEKLQGRIDEAGGVIAQNEPVYEDDSHPYVSYIDELEEEKTGLELERNAIVAHTQEYPAVVELRMYWSQYTDGQWIPKRTSKSATGSYELLAEAEHYFTGWVDDDNRLLIAVRAARLEGGTVWVEWTMVEQYIGYFYLDDCQGGLIFDTAEIDIPDGQVSLHPATHNQNALMLYPDTAYLEFEVGDPKTSRFLLDSLPLGVNQIHYAHQYGVCGSEDSPFFFADDKRIYFVQPREIISGKLESITNGMTTGLPRTATDLLRQPSWQMAETGIRYDGIESQQIIDHSLSPEDSRLVDEQNQQLEAIIAPDKEADSLPFSIASFSTESRYRFTIHYHPHVCLFLKQLSRYGIDGLLGPDPALGTDSENLYRQLMPLESFDFGTLYDPTEWVLWDGTTVEEINFDHNSAYGSYNWELFFHIPVLIAGRLTEEQRFEEARRWFHFIFDPTKSENSEGVGSERFWKIRPFYEAQLDGETETLNGLISQAQQGDMELERQVRDWETKPFQPHAIARMRIIAYMQATVMGYLDNLIQHADMLFAQDQREQVEEAKQLYLLASDILGARPELLPAQDKPSYTPNDLLGLAAGIAPSQGFNNFLGSISQFFATWQPGVPLFKTPPFPQQEDFPAAAGSGTIYATLLLFCIPANTKLLGYWDTIEDRLFKVRHCMNLEGQARRLALYAPPIDPTLLIKAAAYGLEIESIIGSLYAPLPHYRFRTLFQKALELCGEVRTLGTAVLSASENQDAQELAKLQSVHQVHLLTLVKNTKEKQIEEAQAAWEALREAKKIPQSRKDHYQSLLLYRQNNKEKQQLKQLKLANNLQIAAQLTRLLGSAAYMTGAFIEKYKLKEEEFWRGVGHAVEAVAGGLSTISTHHSYKAGKASLEALYVRRSQDWALQQRLSQKELLQIDKQLLTAEIRKQVADKGLESHVEQIAQSKAHEEFLRLKFTNQELYSWMLSELSSLYFQVYQMALQLAQQAQQAFLHELGPDESNLTFIKATYWDSLKKGLLAGEQLHYDLRRMEQAHIETNRRELEITKTVSLFQLDPEALLALRTTGTCEFHIPEVLYELDFPAHYFRRIKAVRMTIPSVVGPATNVSATLTLTESWIRKAPNHSTDPEAVTASPPQISIATSTANNDSGVFELNFNDPRYLPFEGTGAVSSWNLELPTAVRPFDYNSISDVMLHISYTARDGGSTFKEAVNEKLEDRLNDLKLLLNESSESLSRLISLRREFPTEWNRLLHPSEQQTQEITLTVDKTLFPSWLDFLWPYPDGNDQSNSPTPITLNITSARLYLNAEPGSSHASNVPDINGHSKSELVEDVTSGLFYFDVLADLTNHHISNEIGMEFHLTVNNGELQPDEWHDLYLLLDYSVET